MVFPSGVTSVAVCSQGVGVRYVHLPVVVSSRPARICPEPSLVDAAMTRPSADAPAAANWTPAFRASATPFPLSTSIFQISLSIVDALSRAAMSDRPPSVHDTTPQRTPFSECGYRVTRVTLSATMNDE